jgi:hypothetical protein
MANVVEKHSISSELAQEMVDEAPSSENISSKVGVRECAHLWRPLLHPFLHHGTKGNLNGPVHSSDRPDAVCQG